MCVVVAKVCVVVAELREAVAELREAVAEVCGAREWCAEDWCRWCNT